ncbi:sigma-54 interaction domain-containing protein [Mucilaginibacter endophyticus]|uniref:sigma-54 interaction domain-containing protein n=1 Tax=Mucilaginibacter endophyticus TaxID=2675003 RepID=UPI001FCA1775|nr:sigma-54 dependent transcriptional regulator [Mucilaginibacter endophyticus]
MGNETDEPCTELINQPYELSPLQKLVAGFSFPVIKSKEEWMEEESQNHTLLNGESGYEYHCYIPLEVENKILGTLELHNNVREFSAECLTFCSSIADLLADIVFFTQQSPVQSEIAYLTEKLNQQDNNVTSEGFASQLSGLNQQLALINEAHTLEDFLNKVTGLLQAANPKLSLQLEELLAFKVKHENESVYIANQQPNSGNYPQIIGAGPKMNRVFALMDQVVTSDSTVLITGETGTGKELIAKTIHAASARKNKPMISVNCAAIPTNLMESELFGHEKGSFTGATEQRIGKFELANNGTLFLDEIGELPLELQVKLLRALQEKEIERVGGKGTVKTDVRIISATNRDLIAEVERGRFRRDLYYRLHVFPIDLPPLRERTEDIPLLANYFLKRFSKQKIGFSKKAIKQMLHYNWPGNIREMEHLIERQILLSNGPIINEMNLPSTVKTMVDGAGAKQQIKTIEENERDHIFAVLQLCKGRVSGEHGAAKLLGVPATTLNSKIKKLGLNKQHF